MNGIELAKAYYEEYGRAMLHEQFPQLESQLAIGICGSGSECFGYDDKTSQDHDFEPGFCIFIPGEEIIDERTEFRLQRAYSHLPSEFMGHRRSILSPVGGNRHGVIRISDFFVSKCGSPDGKLTVRQWLALPEYALAEAVNGCIFRDDSGEFTAVRKRLEHFPEDIRLKKTAGYLLTMAQSGQYNYSRCLKHGETGAAQLAIQEFADAAMHTAFLMDRRYMPFYKWSFRALRELQGRSELAEKLEYLISSDNSTENASEKTALVEEIAADFAEGISREAHDGRDADRPDSGRLSGDRGRDLEKLAYEVNNRIKDGMLRNMNIFAGVN